MLIGIEGCIGAGKTILLQLFSHIYPCCPIYEEKEGNPFVEDFYQKSGKRLFARHLLYSSLFLQERQLRRALLLSEQGQMVVTDFHPLRNITFAKTLLSDRDQALLAEVYDSLALPQPSLMVYVRADEEVLLARLRKKNSPHLDQLDFTFLTQLRSAYETFFRTYPNRFVTVDTSRLDYFERREDINAHLNTLLAALGSFPSFRARTVGNL